MAAEATLVADSGGEGVVDDLAGGVRGEGAGEHLQNGAPPVFPR
jgi:hypothetical protein